MAAQHDNMQGLYLEDSYLLGIAVTGRQLQLSVLFALTKDHPAYTTPNPGEQHCYHEGVIEWTQVAIIHSRGQPQVFGSADPDGTLDLGSIKYVNVEGTHHVKADWFDLRFTADSMEIVLAT
ncbi:hypothetical protein [Sphingomonas aerophila]|uniref:Uncharacterized protein n=1 Tax=Sphingomonas aerophila TaxID=1344948 RepID=A0A7W9BGF6_9SPHN|nr:hypothetical protein [Sphingomonas aerophila]MBB5716790.1 hypothetical protein [Sphingomonas aerophila]